AGPEEGVGESDLRTVAGGCQQRLGDLSELVNIGACAILDHELEAAARAQTEDGREAECEREGALPLVQPSLDARDDGFKLQFLCSAFFPGLQRANHRSHVGVIGLGDEIKAAERSRVFHPGRGADDFFDLFAHPEIALERRPVREPYGDEKDALVFSRQKTGGEDAEQAAGAEKENGQRDQRERRSSNEELYAGEITVGSPLEGAVEDSKEQGQGSAASRTRRPENKRR